MNQDAGQKSAVYPQEEKTRILSQEEILKAEIARISRTSPTARHI
jgi:hypothetical protein